MCFTDIGGYVFGKFLGVEINQNQSKKTYTGVIGGFFIYDSRPCYIKYLLNREVLNIDYFGLFY